ncbi:MAG: M23 family metallopeptidase [Deltaproteobacteria bacterium]|nr:M23 family metallopeptidase [Deltaproteobacteria bacterium]
MKLGSLPKTFDLRRMLLYSLLLAIITAGAIWTFLQFERVAPTVNIQLHSDYISTKPFMVKISDRGKGLKKVSISLLAAGKEYPIIAEQFESSIRKKNITVTLSRRNLDLRDGPAVLRVLAVDRSYWGFFEGNKTLISKNVTVDLTPPNIQLVIGDRYLNFGGSGVVVYRSSPDTVKSGVKLGHYFFPGTKGHLQDPNAYIVFFAHPYDTPANEKASLVAEDAAGNSGQANLSYSLRNFRLKKRTVTVTDSFIEKKVLPLLGLGLSQRDNLKELFIKVNRELRQDNEAKIRKACEESAKEMLWSETFHQLSNSKVEANFADERTYVYKNETIDHAFHLGYDLAVTRNYPIEAANNGVVVFADNLGIYGNTVIIDHGLGLCTLYSHMSLITVKVADTIKRKQIIGKTGETGLATGDHLHYATLIHGVPVLPLEWWDAKWIKDNILNKIQNTPTGRL